jgi:3-oxoacyl-(acyl-carrier-protein) synthase
MGVVSSLGQGISKTKAAIQNGLKGVRPLRLFSTSLQGPLPVGEVSEPIDTHSVPRTHQLARLAAEQAMAGREEAPDAVVLGVTTGGMFTTETLLKNKSYDPELFRYHAVGSVAEDIARRYRCKGPVITVSTACSSGTAAIKIALEMMRAGLAERVLAGGADSLCRLTYYGFNSLQLIDPEGARPLDKNRRGMSVAEGAAMLLLVANQPDHAVAEILGAGLSCDAYHPVMPHPQGKGALAAMQAAIRDAGISISDIDYINLHGTGTPDNDFSEAKAIHALFPVEKPLLSSVKGAFGHSLAASGAIEAVVAAMSVSNRLVPANVGCCCPDPDLELEPVAQPSSAPIKTVLSNSFGFGGNNAAVIIGGPRELFCSGSSAGIEPMAILGCSCVTGAGDTLATMENIRTGKDCQGRVSVEKMSGKLSPRAVRRLKRLPRMVLSLAIAAHEDSGRIDAPSSVFLGTGWGALSETYDFLTRLFETDGQFPSPTDFVGSVHNAAAGQVAMQFQSTGANVTTTGTDCSFEQSLMAAQLLSAGISGSLFLIGADESHEVLSSLFDRSVSLDEILSDGGGAFCLKRGDHTTGLHIGLAFYENAGTNPGAISSLTNRLGGPGRINTTFGALLAGIPKCRRSEGERQLQAFLSLSGFKNPVIDYRKIVGEFASASAVAAVIAARLLAEGKIPGPFFHGRTFDLNGKGVLILGVGKFITAVEVFAR